MENCRRISTVQEGMRYIHTSTWAWKPMHLRKRGHAPRERIPRFSYRRLDAAKGLDRWVGLHPLPLPCPFLQRAYKTPWMQICTASDACHCSFPLHFVVLHPSFPARLHVRSIQVHLLIPSWFDAMLRLHVFGSIFHVQWWCGQPQGPPHATKWQWWPSQWDLVGRHGGCVGPVGSGLLQALLGTWRVAKDLLGTKVRGADRKRVQARRSGREAEYVRRRNGWVEERTRMAD